MIIAVITLVCIGLLAALGNQTKSLYTMITSQIAQANSSH